MKIFKKVFYFLFVFLLVFAFAGCTKKKADENSGNETKTPTEQVPVNPTEPEKKGISFTINVYDIDGEELGSKVIEKDADFDGSSKGAFLQVLKDNFTVVSYNSDWGTSLVSINGSVVDPYYYLSILENNEYSMVGVDDLVIDDGDVFDFKVVTWQTYDETDLLVDQVVYSFFKSGNINTLFPEAGFSYPLLAALNKFAKSGSYDEAIVNLDLDNRAAYEELYKADFSTEATVSPLLKAALAKEAFGFNNDTIATGLNGLDSGALNSLYYAPYYLMACSLNGTDPSNDVLGYYENLLDYETPCDSVLLALQAYALYQDEFENYETKVATVLEKQKSAISEKGFNDEWGGINCASAAQLVLTLLSLELNPRDYEGFDIVKALLAFEKDGNFVYQEGAEEADLMFSTPQALAALLAYKLSRDTFSSVNIYTK